MSTYQRFKAKAVETGVIQVEGQSYEYLILNAPMESALNGYVLFPRRPVKETGYDGVIAYVPVHGGVTFADESEDGMLYGFDTLHYNSSEFPRTNPEWIKMGIESMIRGILKAAEVEPASLAEPDVQKRAEIAQHICDVSPGTEIGFTGLINVLSGNI